jgi:hypothetical protein
MRPRYADPREKKNHPQAAGVEIVSTTLRDTPGYRGKGGIKHTAQDACGVPDVRFRCKLRQGAPISGKQ